MCCTPRDPRGVLLGECCGEPAVSLRGSVLQEGGEEDAVHQEGCRWNGKDVDKSGTAESVSEKGAWVPGLQAGREGA